MHETDGPSPSSPDPAHLGCAKMDCSREFPDVEQVEHCCATVADPDAPGKGRRCGNPQFGITKYCAQCRALMSAEFARYKEHQWLNGARTVELARDMRRRGETAMGVRLYAKLGKELEGREYIQERYYRYTEGDADHMYWMGLLRELLGHFRVSAAAASAAGVAESTSSSEDEAVSSTRSADAAASVASGTSESESEDEAKVVVADAAEAEAGADTEGVAAATSDAATATAKLKPKKLPADTTALLNICRQKKFPLDPEQLRQLDRRQTAEALAWAKRTPPVFDREVTTDPLIQWFERSFGILSKWNRRGIMEPTREEAEHLLADPFLRRTSAPLSPPPRCLGADFQRVMESAQHDIETLQRCVRYWLLLRVLVLETFQTTLLHHYIYNAPFARLKLFNDLQDRVQREQQDCSLSLLTGESGEYIRVSFAFRQMLWRRLSDDLARRFTSPEMQLIQTVTDVHERANQLLRNAMVSIATKYPTLYRKIFACDDDVTVVVEPMHYFAPDALRRYFTQYVIRPELCYDTMSIQRLHAGGHAHSWLENTEPCLAYLLEHGNTSDYRSHTLQMQVVDVAPMGVREFCLRARLSPFTPHDSCEENTFLPASRNMLPFPARGLCRTNEIAMSTDTHNPVAHMIRAYDLMLMMAVLWFESGSGAVAGAGAAVEGVFPDAIEVPSTLLFLNPIQYARKLTAYPIDQSCRMHNEALVESQPWNELRNVQDLVASALLLAFNFQRPPASTWDPTFNSCIAWYPALTTCLTDKSVNYEVVIAMLRSRDLVDTVRHTLRPNHVASTVEALDYLDHCAEIAELAAARNRADAPRQAQRQVVVVGTDSAAATAPAATASAAAAAPTAPTAPTAVPVRKRK